MPLCVDVRRDFQVIDRLQTRAREVAGYSTLTPLAMAKLNHVILHA
jgi:hypothetical protein